MKLGCANTSSIRHPSFIDLTGKEFGRLSVIKEDVRLINKPSKWACECSCGSIVIVLGHLLRSGKTKSCGCLSRELASSRSKTHGLSKSSTYKSWSGAKDRVLRPGNPKYPSYGGRGIKMCQRWLNSFENFLADMGEKPSSAHSIERINNDGDYCPENCKWATNVEQSANRRSASIITANGKTQSLSEWAKETGIHRVTIFRRLQLGWSPDVAVSRAPNPGIKYARLALS